MSMQAKQFLLWVLFSPLVPRPSLLFILKEDWTRPLRFGFGRGDTLDTRKTQGVKPTSLKSLLPTATRATSVAVNCLPGHRNGGCQIPSQMQQGRSNNATSNGFVCQRGSETLSLDVANLIMPME